MKSSYPVIGELLYRVETVKVGNHKELSNRYYGTEEIAWYKVKTIRSYLIRIMLTRVETKEMVDEEYSDCYNSVFYQELYSWRATLS